MDPRSDLPVARISHPVAGTRVASQLDVVGTCVDDDGVQSVQVRLDDGERSRPRAPTSGRCPWTSPL